MLVSIRNMYPSTTITCNWGQGSMYSILNQSSHSRVFKILAKSDYRKCYTSNEPYFHMFHKTKLILSNIEKASNKLYYILFIYINYIELQK